VRPIQQSAIPLLCVTLRWRIGGRRFSSIYSRSVREEQTLDRMTPRLPAN
jgi:hypothetical protein